MNAPAVDPLDVYRDAVRAKGWRITPFRLGLAVGKAHATRPREVPACPYPYTRSRRSFQAGVEFGIQQERRAAAKAKEEQS